MRVWMKVVGGRVVVTALALMGVLMLAGCAGGLSTSSSIVTATPAFSPAGGTYNASQTVTISDAAAGAVMYCTTDGTTPTTSSPLCSQPTTVFKTEFLQAIAVAPGGAPSAAAAAAYTINLSAAATPTFSPAGGSYAAAQTVTINDANAGVNIYYTTNGSVPTSSSTLYVGPIAVAASETLSAIAIAPGLTNSGVASTNYTIGATGGGGSTTGTPTFSVASGVVAAGSTVSLSDPTPNAAIYYTTDGSTPTMSSTLYATPIAVLQTETINAIAFLGGVASAEASATYTVNSGSTGTGTGGTGTGGGGTGTGGGFSATGQGGTLTISLAAGTYIGTSAATPTETVTLSDSTPGAVITYTISAPGATPGPPITYTSGTPITLSGTETVSATATVSGAGSTTLKQSYDIIPAVLPPLTFTPASGTTITSLQQGQNQVTISDADANPNEILSILVNGTTPSSTPPTATTSLGSQIAITQTSTISAIAVVQAVNGIAQSPQANATYTVNLGTVATPTFSVGGEALVGGGTFSSAQQVSLADRTTGATIFYTLDGSAPLNGNGAPNGTATQYTGQFMVPATTSTGTSTTTISAAATATAFTPSAVGTATITVTPGVVTINGTVMSGSTPVSGAQVQLFQAGVVTPATGQQPGAVYGTGSQVVSGTGAVTTDSSGAFSIGVSCPTSPNDQLYLVATGGTVGSGSGAGPNASLALMSALGSCGGLRSNTQFVVNEVTTVASAYALSPFMTDPDGTPMVGSSSLNTLGLANAFQTASVNLVTPGGVANSFTPGYPGGPSTDPNFVNNSTVPQARINTLANLLNGCASSTTGSACTLLFQNATPPTPAGGPTPAAPTDTLEAILDIAQSPGNNAAALFPDMAWLRGSLKFAANLLPNVWRGGR